MVAKKKGVAKKGAKKGAAKGKRTLLDAKKTQVSNLKANLKDMKRDRDLLLSSIQAINENTLFVVPLKGPDYRHPGAFTDDRGTILRLTDKAVGSVQLISSKAGTRRASHYHKEDSHLCTVVSGFIDYYERPVDERPRVIDGVEVPNPHPLKHFEYGPNQSFVTGPMVEHEMHFPVDTVFVCMANRHRTPAEYEKDLVRLSTPLYEVKTMKVEAMSNTFDETPAAPPDEPTPPAAA